MKIDTSNVDLSSVWVFSEKNQVTTQKKIKFFDLFDRRLGKFKAGPSVDLARAAFTSQWFTMTTFRGQDAVVMSHAFLNELEKMRQILDAISQKLSSMALRGVSIQPVRFERININPYRQNAVKPIEYEYIEKTTYTHQEKEASRFSADGVIQTMDGNSMAFSFQMNLEREYFREDQFVYQEKGNVLIDPLVIHLDTTLPRLSETRASFDLNMDGQEEQMPLLMPGSGFLSLDRNKDGIINDGSELFGPSTGDGFKELSEYDLDHNLWIDENDEIFDELTIWENQENGEMKLTKIKEAGIGAIYLAAAQTPFDLRDGDNQLQAKIKKSGIALNEDGSVSSIQEMDWTV